MAITVSDRVLSITEEKYVPTVIDGVLNSNVFTARLFQREVKRWSGRQMRFPLQHSKPSSGGSFAALDTFDTSAQDTRTLQDFGPKQFYQNVTVIGTEASVNGTDAEVLDIVKTTMEEAQNAMCDSIGDQMYGVGLGNDFQGLGKIVDNGTNTSTYGELSRTTYPLLNSTVQAATAGALSLSLLATVYRGASAASSAKQTPTVLLTTETVFDLYESLLTATVRNNYESYGRPVVTAFSKPGVTMNQSNALNVGTAGFEVLTWRGRPVVADEKCDSGVLFELNENYLHWYKLKGHGLKEYSVNTGNIDSVASEHTKSYPIQWKPMQQPHNQYADIGQFIALGNLISGHTRRHGKATGITTT